MTKGKVTKTTVYMSKEICSSVSKEKKKEYVKVVRCKDCKWFEDEKFCGVYGHETDHDWFCADGERKEKEDE